MEARSQWVLFFLVVKSNRIVMKTAWSVSSLWTRKETNSIENLSVEKIKKREREENLSTLIYDRNNHLYQQTAVKSVSFRIVDTSQSLPLNRLSAMYFITNRNALVVCFMYDSLLFNCSSTLLIFHRRRRFKPSCMTAATTTLLEWCCRSFGFLKTNKC